MYTDIYCKLSKCIGQTPCSHEHYLFFTYTPIFGPGLSNGVIQISRLPTPVARATNFGTKLTTALFAPTPLIRSC